MLEFGPFENVSQISNYIFEQIGSNLQLSKLKDPNILLALRDLEAINFLLEFINVLIFDDISLINTLNATKTLKLSENPNSNHGYPTKNLEFLFANIYLVEPNFNYEPIKTLLKKLKKREIDYLIERISIFNKSRNAYELKEEYKNSFDLILFPESLSLYAKLYERAKSICKKDFSIILGNHDMSFYENPFFIKTMDKIANSDLIEFVVILFLDENNQVVYEKNDILRKVLKLLHLFLQYKASKLKISMFLKINLRKRIDILIIKFKANQDYEIALRKIGQILDESINFEEIKKEPFFSPNKMTDLKLNEKDLKKASILAEFKKKSMKFIEKNHEITDSNMNLKKDEKDLMVCSFCLQNQIKSNDLLGLLAYISKDSITDYIYPGNHSKNNDLLKKKGNFYVNSCNHLVHKECHYSNLTNKNRINMKNYECDIEFMCNYCKNLSNLIVPNIEITCYSPDLSEFINCKKDFLDNPELFLQFVDNYQVKKINLDEMLDIKYKEFFYDFYNELMMAVLGYFEEGMNNSTFEILVEILFDLFEKIYWKDLFSFISNDFLLTTNLFYLSLFDFYQIENNQMILDKCKFKVSLGNVMNVLGNLKNDLNINCLQRDLIKSLLNIRFIFNNDKKLLICATQYLIKSFVSQLMILCFFIYNTDNTHFTLENLMNFFLNNEIKSKTMTFLGPFYSIIIGFLISCFKSYPKLKTLLESSQIENELENSDLLKEFEALLMPEPEICKVYIDNWKNHMNNLTEQDKNKLLLTLKSITNNVKTLSISKINNYDEFLVNCMTKGCYICKFYPRKFKQKLFQCLICDIQLCIGRCDDEKKKIGNLTEHARNFHKGKCIFIDLSEGTLLIIKMSFLLMLRTAFVNKHGDLMKENCMNFSSYLLDKRFVDKWVHSIINRKLAQEVINEISVNPDSLIENPNWSMI